MDEIELFVIICACETVDEEFLESQGSDTICGR